MRKYLILSAAAALAVGGTAMAEGLSYSYVQGDLHVGQLKVPGDSINGIGLGVNGSYGFTDMLFGTAALDAIKYKEDGEHLTLTNLSLGVGGHLPITSTLDFVGAASFEQIKYKNGGSNTDSGWGVSAGVRGVVNEQVQWNGGLKYSDIGDSGSALGINIGARYFFQPGLSAGADLGYRKFDDSNLKETILTVSARYEFAGL